MTENTESQETQILIEEQQMESQSSSYGRILLGIGLAVVALSIIGVLVWPNFAKRQSLSGSSPSQENGLATEGSAEELFQLGEQYYQSEQWDKAVDAYQKAVSLKPDYDAAYTNLGSTYYRRGHLDLAIEAYEKSLSIVAKDADTHHNLGMVHLQLWLTETPPDDSHLDKAFEQINQAIELNRTLAAPYYGLGVIHQSRNDTPKAIEAFEKFLEFDEGSDPMATTNATQLLQSLKSQ